jgi:hypothetical protein
VRNVLGRLRELLPTGSVLQGKPVVVAVLPLLHERAFVRVVLLLLVALGGGFAAPKLALHVGQLLVQVGGVVYGCEAHPTWPAVLAALGWRMEH